MRSTRAKIARTAVVSSLALAVVATSGCGWIHSKKNSAYQMPEAQRPLEIPPDLDRPAADAAMNVPEGGNSVMASTMRAASSSSPARTSATDFTVPGTRDAVFQKVGDALAKIPGVTINSKAQLLGSYDVAFQGSSFLVRLNTTDKGVFVSTVDQRGQPEQSDAAVQLMAQLKTALGG